MNKKILLSIMMVFLMIQPSTSQSTTIRVVGSNTVFPIMEVAASRFQELNTEIEISIEGPGSGAGIAALIDGQTDIAPMSRAPKTKEKEEAVAKEITLNVTTIALDALVIIVNKENPINGLTTQQITDIYNGTTKSWVDLGWAEGGSITVIERDENSGTHDYFNEHFLDGEEVDPTKVSTHKQEASTSQLFQLVADEKNAIGYGGLAYVDDTVKSLNVDGVAATKEGAKTGDYSVSRPLFLVFDEKTITKSALDFVNYVIGPEGQYLVNEVGYVAIFPMADGLDVSEGNNVPISFMPLLVAITVLGLIRRKLK